MQTAHKEPLKNAAVKNALMVVGIKPLPVANRIWDWLKDHPHHTAADVCKALELPSSTASAQCSGMAQRKMLTFKSEYSAHLRRELLFYSAVGAAYKKKPLPENHVPAHRPINKKARDAMALAKQLQTVPQDVQKLSAEEEAELILDTASIKLARALFEKLIKLFGRTP